VSYFVLAFAGAWLFLAPMVLGQDGLGLLPYSVPFWLYVGLFLSATFVGPTMGALVVTSALEGKEGVGRFLRRYGQWRVGLRVSDPSRWLSRTLPNTRYPLHGRGAVASTYTTMAG
jgi:hypothetical protein